MLRSSAFALAVLAGLANAQTGTGFAPPNGMAGFMPVDPPADDGCPAALVEKPPPQSNSPGCQWIVANNAQNCQEWQWACDKPSCPLNESWYECASDCEPTCGNPQGSCPKSCGFSACQCTATIGATFFRSHKGSCVTPDNCDCPDGERLGDGGSFCEPTCANRMPLCALRAVLKALPQCVCVDGLIRDQTTGRCVPEDQCSGGGNGPPPVTEAPPPPQQQGCSADSDCGSRTVICEENVCVQGCLSSNECGANAVCANGRCINQPRPQPPRPPMQPPAQQCQIDVNCQPGSNCQNGRCVPGCNSNSDCLNGWSCNRQNGRCIRQGNCGDDSQCNVGQFCARNTCQDGCRMDNQCPGPQVCRNNNCVDDQPPPCRRGRDCPGDCRRDNVCDRGEICQRNRCQRGCRNDFQCPGRKVCRESRCGNTKECRHDRNCPGDTFCFRGLCSVRLDESCRRNDDCPGDQLCANRHCTEPFFDSSSSEED